MTARRLTTTKARQASREAKRDAPVTMRVREDRGDIRLVVLDPTGVELVNAPVEDAEWLRTCSAVTRILSGRCP